MNKIISITLVALLLLGGYTAFQEKEETVKGISDAGCSVETVTAVNVGHQLSTTVLAAKSNRAWAIIAQPLNATNTAALSFDEGAAATLNGGLQLSPATTTEANIAITFGRNTDFPYTGAVTALTSTGSTTLQVTECLY